MTDDTRAERDALALLAAQRGAEKRLANTKATVDTGRINAVDAARAAGVTWTTIATILETTPDAIRLRCRGTATTGSSAGR
jgi:hypothetical protein